MHTPSLKDYLAGTKPTPGTRNPERIRLSYCDWMIRRGLDRMADENQPACAFSARRDIGVPEKYGAFSEYAPGWCFQRFGMSRTELADGTILYVAGEHEDSYDPDFCIYNDVVRIPPGGEPELYRYPVSVFPPTDFHTATLVGKTLFLIGNLGYTRDRRPGFTPIHILDTETLEIRTVDTSGDAPGWIHSHEAVWVEESDTILVQGGTVSLRNESGEGTTLAANFDTHALCLKTLRWSRVHDRSDWRAYGIRHADRDEALALLQDHDRLIGSLSTTRLAFTHPDIPELSEPRPQETSDDATRRILWRSMPARIAEGFLGEYDILLEGLPAEPEAWADFLRSLAAHSAKHYGIRFQVVEAPRDFRPIKLP